MRIYLHTHVNGKLYRVKSISFLKIRQNEEIFVLEFCLSTFFGTERLSKSG